jgi:hypothetical protein
MQETSDDQEYALHAVVLAAGSLYFRWVPGSITCQLGSPSCGRKVL